MTKYEKEILTGLILSDAHLHELGYVDGDTILVKEKTNATLD